MKVTFEHINYAIEGNKITCIAVVKYTIDGLFGGSTVAREVIKRSTICSDEDTFDETLGKRIAESKCKIAAYKSVMDLAYNKNKPNNINRLCIVVSNFIHKINESVEKYTIALGNEEEHLNYLKNGKTER